MDSPSLAAKLSDVSISSPKETSVVYTGLKEGLDLMWSNKFDQAEKVFAKHKEINPRFALHYAEVMVFRSIISELASDREVAIDRLNTSIRVSEELVKALDQGMVPKSRAGEINKRNFRNYQLDAKIVLADAHTLLAALQILEEQRVKGVLNLRKGWKMYKQILGEIGNSAYDPDVICSLKFGAGLFHFIISLIPPGLPQKAAAIAGFSGGDKDLGITYLRETFYSGSIRSHLAGVVLALNHLFLTDDLDPKNMKDCIAEAQVIIKNGVTNYPQGSIFQAVASLTALETNAVEDAITYATAAIQNCSHVTTYPAIFLRLLSNGYAMKLDWKATADCLEKIWEKGIEQEKKRKSKNPWAYTWNSVKLGACCMMTGETEKAKKILQLAANSKTKDTWSQMLIVQANKFLATGGQFAMLELMLLTGHIEKLVYNTTDEKRQEFLEI